MMPASPTSPSIQESSSASKSRHTRHGSRASITSESNSALAAKIHQEYLNTLVPPSQELVKKITLVQEQKEEDLMKKLSQDNLATPEERKRVAAEVIQRNYRGHRERRMLNGMSLDPSTRWVEAIKEARYRHLTEPRARVSIEDGGMDGEIGRERIASTAKQNWKKISVIARRAGGDEDPDSDSGDDEDVPQEERETHRKHHLEEKLRRQNAAKMMDLQYFLEMVDLKHRYGSNLRTYHEEWKKAETKENFFYWLDHGEGRFIDCQGCPREKLDREQVRYLSREERLNYLVQIDQDGRLCWAKNGARIDTTEKCRDSIHGIVPESDPTPSFTPIQADEVPTAQDSSSGETSWESSTHEEDSEDGSAHKPTSPHYYNKPMKKVRHVSAATILDRLLRGSIKANTWIFVADTNFRLYVGMKQSGAFQHSSFLHGSRISAAGSIKIKNGRISNLSPLSGHYRPPVSNFKAFIGSLKDAGVDMSHVSISRSYAILVGLEAYVKGRKRGNKLVQKFMHGLDKLLSPEELARREEEERDKTESAERERRFLELKRQAERENEDEKIHATLREKLHIGSRVHEHDTERRKEA